MIGVKCDARCSTGKPGLEAKTRLDSKWMARKIFFKMESIGG